MYVCISVFAYVNCAKLRLNLGENYAFYNKKYIIS